MKPKKQNFTVLLLYPDYLANDFGSDTYLAHVKAASVKKAIITARHDFINKFGTFPADQLKFCLDYLKGDCNAKKIG